jgi:ubiquinone/menaquinone biosynthesis C-methylase UbiE
MSTMALTNPKKHWHAVGVDYGSAAVDYARLQGLDAHVSDVESMHFAPQTFDAVVALHVMEHVQNLEVFIKEIHRVMKQGGYFFAVMPNMSHYKPKLAGASWKFWGPPGHLWYFTNHSLTMFLENHGFEVKHCSSLYHRAHVRVLARKK